MVVHHSLQSELSFLNWEIRGWRKVHMIFLHIMRHVPFPAVYIWVDLDYVLNSVTIIFQFMEISVLIDIWFLSLFFFYIFVFISVLLWSWRWLRIDSYSSVLISISNIYALFLFLHPNCKFLRPQPSAK